MKPKMSDYTFIFPIGAAGYSLLEVLWRGYTHWSMAFAGGACFCCIYAVFHLTQIRFFTKCLLCSALVTGIEFIFGCIFNLLLHMNVWDYSSLPLHLLGQICLPYTALWFLLSIPLFPLCAQLERLFRKLDSSEALRQE